LPPQMRVIKITQNMLQKTLMEGEMATIKK